MVGPIRAGGGCLRVGGTVQNPLKGGETEKRGGQTKILKRGRGKLDQGVGALKMGDLEPKLWLQIIPRCFLVLSKCCEGLGPASIYLLNVNNTNNRPICEISSELAIKTPVRRNWYHSGTFVLTLNNSHTLFWCFHCWL